MIPELLDAWDRLSEKLEDEDAGNDEVRDAAIAVCDAFHRQRTHEEKEKKVYIRFENPQRDLEPKEVGPFRFVQMTYEFLRDEEGNDIAWVALGEAHVWILASDPGSGPWSDYVIFAK